MTRACGSRCPAISRPVRRSTARTAAISSRVRASSTPRRLDAARRLLGKSGYAGEPIVCMAAQDLPHHKAWGDVTVDLLQRLGVNVDFVAVDWGTVVARRAQKKPPGQGGWHVYPTSIFGVDCVIPTTP